MIVEVDPETAAVEIKRYVVVHDCGTIINPLLVEGQIHGGVAHGIGNAFYESLVYDEQAQLLNASFMDYLLPTATEVPTIETAHRDDALAVQRAGPQGRRRGWVHSDGRGVRAGGRGRAVRTPASRSARFRSAQIGCSRCSNGGTPLMTLDRQLHVRRTASRRVGSAAGSRGARQGAARHEDADEDGRRSLRRRDVGQHRPGDGGRVRRDGDAERPGAAVAPHACRSRARAASASCGARRQLISPMRQDGETTMTYSSDVLVGGRIAAVGQRMIESVREDDDPSGPGRAERRIAGTHKGRRMKPAPFAYFRPRTLDEALALLAEHGDAKPLAGGQSLIPAMNFRLAMPAALIDLNALDDLAYINEDSGGGLRVGAMTRHRAVERSDVVRREAPLAYEAMPFDRASGNPHERHDWRKPGARRSGGRAACGDAGARCENWRAEPAGHPPGPGDRVLYGIVLDRARRRRARHRDRRFPPCAIAALGTVGRSWSSRDGTATLRWPAWPRRSRSTIAADVRPLASRS